MANKVTLEQAERLVAQLMPQEQIKLYISEWLSRTRLSEADEESWRQSYPTRVEAFLKMSDEMAAETIGEVDSAEDMRQIREERRSRL
jgi:hypothetical protein